MGGPTQKKNKKILVKVALHVGEISPNIAHRVGISLSILASITTNVIGVSTPHNCNLDYSSRTDETSLGFEDWNY